MTEARKKEGCCNCMVAFRENGKLTFQAPEALEDLEELSYTYTYAEGSNYADNKQNIYRKKPTGADITLSFSDVKSRMVAKILGKKYVKGGYTTDVDEKPEPVGILFQENYSDGSYINTVFYNTKFARDENSAKTSGENIEFSGITLTGKALPFKSENIKSKGDIDYRIDSAESDADQEQLKKFFEEVQYIGTPTASAKKENSEVEKLNTEKVTE